MESDARGQLGGIPEVIEDGINGLLVEPDNPKKLASAIDKLISNRGRMKEMGEKGIEIYMERFTLVRMMDEIEAIYEEISGQKKGQRHRGTK